MPQVYRFHIMIIIYLELTLGCGTRELTLICLVETSSGDMPIENVDVVCLLSLIDPFLSAAVCMFLVWGGLICDLCLLVHVCVQWHVSMHVRLTSRVFLHQAPPSLSLNPRVPCFCLAGQSACSRNPRSTSQARVLLGFIWVLGVQTLVAVLPRQGFMH